MLAQNKAKFGVRKRTILKSLVVYTVLYNSSSNSPPLWTVIQVGQSIMSGIRFIFIRVDSIALILAPLIPNFVHNKVRTEYRYDLPIVSYDVLSLTQ